VFKLFLALMDSNFEGKQGLYEETTKKVISNIFQMSNMDAYAL